MQYVLSANRNYIDGSVHGRCRHRLLCLLVDDFPHSTNLSVNVILQCPARSEDMLIPRLKIGLLRLAHLGHEIEKFLCCHSLFITFLSQFIFSWFEAI